LPRSWFNVSGGLLSQWLIPANSGAIGAGDVAVRCTGSAFESGAQAAANKPAASRRKTGLIHFMVGVLV